MASPSLYERVKAFLLEGFKNAVSAQAPSVAVTRDETWIYGDVPNVSHFSAQVPDPTHAVRGDASAPAPGLHR